MATRLGDMAVGSTVKIKVNGAAKNFIIVHQGLPSSAYDASCNGTWLLMKDIYTEFTFGNNNSYKGSSIHAYLNGTFYNLFDSNIRNAIKQVKIPYQSGTGYGGSLATGSNGLSTKVFLLSGYEVGWTTSNNSYFPRDGAKLDYFGKDSDGNSKRVAYNGRYAVIWWLRSPYTDSTLDIWSVHTDGFYGKEGYANSYGVRPAFILPSTLVVFDDGTVSVNQPPEVTSDAGATGAELGEKNVPFTVGYTVTDKDGDLMAVTEKLNGAHSLTLMVSDGKTSTDWTATFTKNVTGAKVSLTAPLTADDAITVASLTLEGTMPEDMSLTVEMTNNGLDDSPAWENCTDIQSGESRAFVHHAFTNKTAARGFAFNYKVTITRGESGVGGSITMIGGVIG